MRQILQDKRDGSVELHEVPAPGVRPGFVLVRNAASLISSGTERAMVDLGKTSLLGKAIKRPDLVRKLIDTARTRGVRSAVHAVSTRLDEPTPLGYSSAGVALQAGPQVADIVAGDRVACAGFGYATHAEIVAVPTNLVVPIPDDLSFEDACFVALGAIALHGVRLSGSQVGDTVVVIGLGLIGLLAVQILEAAGVKVLGVDVFAERCRLAEQLGACHAVPRAGMSLDTALAFTDDRGADAVVIAAATDSNDPVELAGELARDRATVSVIGDVGMQIPRATYYQKELTLRLARSYGPGRYDPIYEEAGIDYPIGYVPWPERRNMAAFLSLIAEGQVNVRPLITDRYPFDRAPDAYAALSRDPAPISLVLTYPEVVDATRAIAVTHPEKVRPGGAGISFLGAGNFARSTLLPHFAKEGTALRGVVTRSAPSALAATRRFDFAFSATDPAQVFEDEETDVVVIATHHDTHARLACEVLHANKHVYVEKPPALTLEELDDLIAAMASSPSLLTVGYNRRFAPLTRVLKDRIPFSGPVSAIYRVAAGHLPPDHWTRDPAVGGGRIVGEACHFVDLLQYLIGAEPREVWAAALPSSDGGTVETTTIGIRFCGDSLANIHYLGMGAQGIPKERLEIFAPGFAAVLDDFRSLLIYRDGRRWRKRLRAQDKGYAALVKEFLDACRTGGEPPIPYRSLEMTSKVTFLAEEAFRDGRPKRLGA